MALPAFFSRVADSLRPVADVDPDVLAAKFEDIRVRIDVPSSDTAADDAFLLACNLAARLYPHISLGVSAEDTSTKDGLSARARELIVRINPTADVTTGNASPASAGDDIRLVLGTPSTATDIADQASPAGRHVTVIASGWDVVVDPTATYADAARPRQPGHPLAWLAAAAIGMAEVFRSVFTDELGERGRTGPQPGGLNLLTAQAIDPTKPPADTAERDTDTRADPAARMSGDIGEVHLVGAGAIGQAAVLALSALDVTGVLHVVDPETVTMSNLQRYLLTDATSVGAVKVDLVATALAPNSDKTTGRANQLEVHVHQERWGDSAEHLEADQVLVALDTARDRITVAATQPRHAYNAWTQVADLGWSRHEQFGTQPCLACLYYPSEARPSDHELIAEALHQPPLRVLAYLTYNLPIGYPLPGIPAVAELPAPPDAGAWTQVALIEDLISTGVIGEAERHAWANATIGTVYRDGICAGGLLPVGDLPGDVLVPLAHQSALAGIMLAAELLWSRRPELAAQRDTFIEHRYDVLRGFPQVAQRPRERTPHCICSDLVYLHHAAAASQTAQLSSL